MNRLAIVVVVWGVIVSACTVPPSPVASPRQASEAHAVVVTRARKFGYDTWKIEAAGGTWHFEIASAVANASRQHTTAGTPSTGFNSAIDRSGNDWIANDCLPNTPAEGTGSREWRGWPNFAPDGFGHPCRGGGGQSRWVTADGRQVTFDERFEGDLAILESWNDTYRVRYHFFPTHAAIEVLDARGPYAFLFEGPVAGRMSVERQRYVLEDGVERPFTHDVVTGCAATNCLGHIDAVFGGNFPSPFFYLLDPQADQVLYIGAAGQSDGGDEGWAQARNMVIFSFGRENDRHALTGTSATSVFGFLDRDLGHDGIRTYIRDRLAAPFATASRP